MPNKDSTGYDSTTKKWAAKNKKKTKAKAKDLGSGTAKSAADKMKARRKMLDSI